MKMAMLISMLVLSSSAIAADEPSCSHSVDRNPDNVGYSVSASRAENVARSLSVDQT